MPKSAGKSIPDNTSDSSDTLELKAQLRKKLRQKRKERDRKHEKRVSSSGGSGKKTTKPGRSRPNPATSSKPGRTRSNPAGSSHLGQSLGLWEKSAVLAAWEDHKTGMSMRAVAEKHGVPKSTISDKFRKARELEAAGVQDLSPIFGHCSGGKEEGRVFTFEEELALCDHLALFADGGSGLTCKEFREVAHHWGVENKIPNVNPFQGAMSYRWYYAFIQRHPHLENKKPMELSLHRATAPSQWAVDHFFNQYQSVVEKYNLGPSQIWNIDETGMLDQPKAQKVIIPVHSPKFQLVSGERGQLTTVLAFANASGDWCKPTVIMKGENFNPAWREFKPDGWLLFNSHNGYINKQIFLKTGRKFLKYLEDKGVLGQRHLVLLDGHASHSYNFALTTLFAAHKVSVIQFPAHCTHFLQPYDSVMLALLKKNWQDELRVYSRMYAGHKLNKVRFFIPFRKVWRNTMKPHIIQSAFRKTGIWPLDRERVSSGWFKARQALLRCGAIIDNEPGNGPDCHESSFWLIWFIFIFGC